MLSLPRLATLVVLSKRRSITATAEALGYTASAVSQQLAQLERETGVALLERAPRSVRLTEAGERLARHAEAIIAAASTAETEMKLFAGLQRGTVRLAAFPSAVAAFVPPLLDACSRRLPGVRLSVEEYETAAAVEALKRGDAEIALVYDFTDQPLKELPGVRVQALREDAFRLCVPSRSDLASANAVDLRDVDLAWIADGEAPASRCFAMRFLADKGMTPTVVARSNDNAVVHRLVAAGVGVAMLPELQIDLRSGDVASVRIADPPPPRRVLLATRTGSKDVPVLRTVGALVEEAVRTSSYEV